MTHLLIVLVLGLLFYLLVRFRVMQVDLSLPWFLAVFLLGLASTNVDFVESLGRLFGILYAPIAVIFLVIFLLFGIIVTLSVMLSRVRQRQIALTQRLAEIDLKSEELRLADRLRG